MSGLTKSIFTIVSSGSAERGEDKRWDAAFKKEQEQKKAKELVRSGLFITGKPEYAITDKAALVATSNTTATVAVNDVVPVQTTFGGCTI